MPDRPSPTDRPHPAAAAGDGRVPTGNRLLDQLLLGGLPRGSACLLVGSAFSGKEWIAAGAVRAAAEAGAPALVCLTGMPPERFRGLAHRDAAAGKDGPRAFVDCYRALVAADDPDGPPPQGRGLADLLGGERTSYGAPAAGRGDPGVVQAPHPLDPRSLLRAAAQARRLLGDPPEMLAGVLSVTDLALRFGGAEAGAGHPWMARLLAHLRGWGSTTLMSVEAGAHPEWEMARLQAQCDGAIELTESEDARCYLRVRGLGAAATRDWVEYRAHGEGLDIIGSFTERKIR